MNNDKIRETEIYKFVNNVIKKHRLISERENELINAGFFIKTISAGSGGVGQILRRKDGVWVQIGYGKGQWNYANCVLIGNFLPETGILFVEFQS